MTEVNPVTYCVDLNSRLKKFKDNFDQTHVREEFLRKQTSDNQRLTTLEGRFLNQMEIRLIDDIPAHHVKDYKQISVKGESIPIPMIENNFLEKYEKVFNTIINLQLEQFLAERILRSDKIDKSKTLQNIREIAFNKQRGFSRDPRRTSLNVDIITAIIITMLRQGTRPDLETYLRHRTILDDEITGGMFIQLTKDNVEDSEPSMIKPDSIGVELKVIYNLSYEQLQLLIKYLFTCDPAEKTESKIRLLSSTKSEIRNDVALNPEKVFEHSIREHFLTRQEVLELIFQHSDKQTGIRTRRCPYCKLIIGTSANNALPHQYCKVSKWLVDKLGFIYENNHLQVPNYTYIVPGVARYAKEAYGVRTQLQTEPFYGRTQTEFVAYTIDDKGRPLKVAQQGIKTVRLDHEASTSHRR